MGKRLAEILLVERDADSAEMLEGYLHAAMPVHVTHAASGGESLREELTHRHDLILVALDVGDVDGLTLIDRLRVSNKCPIILLAESLTTRQVIEAMRLGVMDVFVKPFEWAGLAATVARLIRSEARQRRQRIRHRRLRLLTARILNERRDLRQRIDLICQDIVQAYRRLAHEVAESGVLTRTPACSSAMDPAGHSEHRSNDS